MVYVPDIFGKQPPIMHPNQIDAMAGQMSWLCGYRLCLSDKTVDEWAAEEKLRWEKSQELNHAR